VATVPPTLALCRQYFGARAPVVFGWVFASHQIGAALAAFGAGVVREATGSYDAAWYGAAGLCVFAAALSISIRRRPTPPGTTLPVTPLPAAAAEAHG
jgi:predicted MFS family arabinose efflux permease